MPILNVDHAQNVVVLKRSMNPGFAGIDNPLFARSEDGDAVRRREVVGREACRRRQVSLVPLLRAADVEAAVSPERAVEAVRDAFVAYARGEWTMPPKVYVPAYPAGDFRAMPAHGGGYALLKWVSSFPGNPARGLPTVMGMVLLSDASYGPLRRAARRGGADGAAHRGRGRARSRDPGRDAGGGGGDRRRREREGGGADVPRPGQDGCSGTSTGPGRGRRGGAGRDVRRVAEAALAADVVATVTPGQKSCSPRGRSARAST